MSLSDQLVAPLNRPLNLSGPMSEMSMVSQTWAVKPAAFSASRMAGMPFALNFSATAKNSSQVVGGFAPISANGLSAAHRTFARWMLTGTDQGLPFFDAISIKRGGKTFAQPSSA